MKLVFACYLSFLNANDHVDEYKYILMYLYVVQLCCIAQALVGLVMYLQFIPVMKYYCLLTSLIHDVGALSALLIQYIIVIIVKNYILSQLKVNMIENNAQ